MQRYWEDINCCEHDIQSLSLKIKLFTLNKHVTSKIKNPI